MKRLLSFLGLISTALVMATISLAQAPAQFSADMSIHANRGEDMKGKFYFGGKKVRSDMTTPGGSVSNITDVDAKKMYTVMHSQKMYMEHDLSRPMGPMGRGPRMPEVKEYNASNPCANEEGVTCKNTGTETVNGRTCDVWEFTKNGQKDRTVWIDQKLHISVKTVHQDGTSFEFSNIKEGTHPASLFEIPSGYQKMDMGGFGGMMGGQRPPK